MEIQEIKSRLTITAVLQHYGLKPDRNHRLKCPFHDDKTPSMQVYYKTQTAYCFSSNCITHGKSMDVIDFIMNKENTDKHQALLKCAEIINYFEGKVSHQHNLPHQGGEPLEITAALTVNKEDVLQTIFTYFKNAVYYSKPAHDYIKSRGLEAVKLEIGYNTAQFHHGQRRDEILINNCVALGLLAPWGLSTRKPEEQAYKVFGKECIVFTLRNESHQITGMYFRSITNDENQKHFYLKNSTGLYPSYPNPSTQKLIITESVIDAASLLQIEAITKDYSVLAAYGVNRLNEEHKAAIIALKQLNEIIFAFDNDEAGRQATVKYANELKATNENLIISTLELPLKDVNETLTAHSDENIFIELLENRKTIFSFSTEKETEKQASLFIETESIRTPETITSKAFEAEPKISKQASELDTSNLLKIKFLTPTANYFIQGGLPKTNDHLKVMLVIEEITSPLSTSGEGPGVRARNRIDLYEDKQVEKLCKEVSEKLQLRKDLLEADIYKLTDLLENFIEETQALNTPSGDGGNQPAQVLTLKEREKLEAFAKQPKLIKKLNELLGKTGIVGEHGNRVFLFIIALSHKMPETLHALIQGSSGSGKTRLLKQISDCMPKESVTKLTRLSDKVLYNFPENYFMNRLLCLEDIDGLSEEAEFAFRELQSNGELNSATSIKLENGQITSGQKIVRGPIASLACTTKGEIYEDNMSRVFLIAVDESLEQTKKIIEYQNQKAAGEIDYKKEQEIKAQIQKFSSILKPYEVVNPYANKIQLPEEAHKIRRLNDLFQSFIKMVTTLNQYQRKTDERKRLIVDVEDIEVAIHIMFESIVLKVDELDGSLRQFYEKLKIFIDKKSKGYEFTRFEIKEATGVGKTQQHYYINQLVSLEYVQQNGFANRGFKYKIVHWDNYTKLREKIKNHLTSQLESIKAEHHRTPARTPEPL